VGVFVRLLFTAWRTPFFDEMMKIGCNYLFYSDLHFIKTSTVSSKFSLFTSAVSSKSDLDEALMKV
jgi:hypothetical protein